MTDPSPSVHLSSLGAFVDGGKARGISAGLLRDGMTETAFFGHAGHHADSPTPDERTRFTIASITKTFTALLFADMVIRGEVALSGPIGDYLPGGVRTPRRPDGANITLEDLASHTSGLPRDPDLDWDDDDRAWAVFSTFSADDLYLLLSEHEPDPTEGGARYSNVGISLLGHICSLVADRPYDELMAERVCEPLGLFDTDFTDRPGVTFAQGYDEDGAPKPPFAVDVLRPCGGLRSSLEDMLAYLRAMLEPSSTALEEAILLTRGPRAALTGEGVDPERDWQVGLGWIVGDDLLWHNGGTNGYRSYAAFRPGRKCAVVVLANTCDIEGLDQAALAVLESEPG